MNPITESMTMAVVNYIHANEHAQSMAGFRVVKLLFFVHTYIGNSNNTNINNNGNHPNSELSGELEKNVTE
jgi:hypothetical protein